MSIDPGGIEKAQAAVETALREHWKLFLIEGIVLLILGGIAVIAPPLATLTVTLVLGWLFLISGVIGLSGYVHAQSGKVYAFSFLFNRYRVGVFGVYNLQDEMLKEIIRSG